MNNRFFLHKFNFHRYYIYKNDFKNLINIKKLNKKNKHLNNEIKDSSYNNKISKNTEKQQKPEKQQIDIIKKFNFFFKNLRG